VTRIVLVHQPVGGGVGRHVVDLAGGLADRGHEVFVCGPAPPSGLCDTVTHVPLSLRREIAPRGDLAAVTAFCRIVRGVRPDLIHAHSSKAGAVARIARVAYLKTPVLYTPHGYAFAGHFSRELERRAYREIERVLALASTRVVCVCEAEARLARTVSPANRVKVVHNGIEPPGDGPTDPRVAELARRGPVVCALTQLRPGKGLETLIDATARLLPHRPDLQVAICGEGPDLQTLRARADANGSGQAVHFLGASADPLSMLRGADLFVHPSWAEAFPYVILEAMSLGLAIVSSDVGGIGEALIDGQSGMLVSAGDDLALASALDDLLGDAERRARLGAAAKHRMGQRFTRTKMIEGIELVYGEVTGPKPEPEAILPRR
jgi:glycosyltransferase involved in cell wall biosynthesis